MTTAAEVAAALGGKKSGKSWTACCPAHADKTPSLSISDGDGKTLIRCHAGCTQDAVLDALAGRGIDLREPRQAEHVSVAAFAAVKRLDSAFLKANRVRDAALDGGVPAVAFDYADIDGRVTGTKFRRGLNGADRGFFWQRGSKPSLYGLWRLADMMALDQRVVLVEGESDSLTLWAAGFTALGVPGASMWKEQWAAMIPDSAQVYAVVEPDDGGAAMLKSIEHSKLASRVKLIRMPEKPKDSSDLYLSDPEHFVERFEALIATAAPATTTDPEPKATPTIQLRTALEIGSDPVRPWWLLKPYLERNVSVLVYGDLGALKSFMVLEWALRVAEQQLPVVFLHAEGRGLWKRLRAWAIRRHPDRPWQEVLRALPFYAVERPTNLSSATAVQALQEAVTAAGIKPALFIVDTMSKNSDGQVEASTEDATAYLNLLDREIRALYEATVIYVHHVGHNEMDRARGPRALMANTEANFRVERPDATKLVIVVTPGRMKDTETPPPFEVVADVVPIGERDDDGLPISSLVLSMTGREPTPARARPTGKNQKRLLAELERRAAEPDELGIWTEGELREIARNLNMTKQSARDAVLGLRQLKYFVATIGGSKLQFQPEGTKERKRDETTNSCRAVGDEKNESP